MNLVLAQAFGRSSTCICWGLPGRCGATWRRSIATPCAQSLAPPVEPADHRSVERGSIAVTSVVVRTSGFPEADASSTSTRQRRVASNSFPGSKLCTWFGRAVRGYARGGIRHATADDPSCGRALRFAAAADSRKEPTPCLRRDLCGFEHDLLGELAVPADAYYGVQTARALENFHISGVQLRLYPDLIRAFAMVKMAAARANHECGQFDRDILAGIEGACEELIDGQAARPVPARRASGRRRHLDEHERQRGHRQPRAGVDGARQGRVPATATRTITSTDRSPPTTPTRRRCTWASRSATPA